MEKRRTIQWEMGGTVTKSGSRGRGYHRTVVAWQGSSHTKIYGACAYPAVGLTSRRLAAASCLGHYHIVGLRLLIM